MCVYGCMSEWLQTEHRRKITTKKAIYNNDNNNATNAVMNSHILQCDSYKRLAKIVVINIFSVNIN